MAENQLATGLFSLPNEIILEILAYTCEDKLDPDLDLVCKPFRNLMISVYRQSYGNGPTPSAMITPTCWKKFALRDRVYQDSPPLWYISDVCIFRQSMFMFRDYAIRNQAKTHAKELIYCLHANPESNPEGVAAIAAALCTLDRKDEAQKLLKRYGTEDVSDQWKWLLNARFGIDFPIDWPEVPKEWLLDCRKAAAIGGNLDLLLKLRQSSSIDGRVINEMADEWAAIQGHSLEALQCLLDTYTDNLDKGSWNYLIQAAVLYNNANALQLLLQRVGSQFDLQRIYEHLLCRMNSKILKLFKQHSPRLVGSYLPDGDLQIVHTMILYNSLEYKLPAIKSLVEDDSVDINAVGKNGFAAVHFAAFKCETEVLELLEELGADMESNGHIQQTPKEILYSQDKTYGNDFFSQELFEKKENLAKQWLTEYMSAVFSGRKGWKLNKHDILKIKAEFLAEIWAGAIGLQTLKELCSLLGKPEYKSIEKLGFIIRTHCHLHEKSSPTNCDPHTLLDIEDIQNRFGMDFGTAIAKNFDFTAVAETAESMSVPVNIEDVLEIEDILRNFGMDFGTIHMSLVDPTAVAQYAARILDPVDISHLRDFVNSGTGRALRLRDDVTIEIESRKVGELRDLIGS